MSGCRLSLRLSHGSWRDEWSVQWKESTLPKLDYLDISGYYQDDVHGRHLKDLIVLHETISADQKGFGDILSVVRYLDEPMDYGIHGVTDFEGNKAWARGLGNAVFWQAGGVNERSIGIEQVSKVPLLAKSNEARTRLWAMRDKELRATAKLCAAIHNTKPHEVPLKFSDGESPGITSHWNVSQHHASSEGHYDCKPKHLGGYYPIMYVIYMARGYAATGIHL